MKISLRQEQTTDHLAVEKLVEEAFKDEVYSDPSYHPLLPIPPSKKNSIISLIFYIVSNRHNENRCSL